MDRGLGLGQPLEQVHRAILPASRQSGPTDESCDFLEAVVVVRVTVRRGGKRRVVPRIAGPEPARFAVRL